MALRQPLSQETNLVGLVVRQDVIETSTTIYVQFSDRKTGAARTPQSSTKLFTFDKDSENFEMILASSHSTTDGVTTITVATNGRALPSYGTGAGSSTGLKHPIGTEVGCADVHFPLEVINKIIDGTEATSANNFRVGDGTDSDITYYAYNADANKPFFGYSASLSKWLMSNDGVNSFDPQAGGSGVTAGEGISIIAGVVANDRKTKVSATDTTAALLNDKITVSSGAGATVTKSITSPAGNEKVNIDVALNSASFLSAYGVSDHLVYTPAFLTGGSGAEGTFSNWLAILNGSYRISFDGTPYDITGVNCTGATSMNDVMAILQARSRAVTGGTETYVWSTDHIVITSGNTTSSSAITVTSAVGSGTDISGAGASNWMDCNIGSGVVTAAVVNRVADAGKFPLLDASGNLKSTFLEANLREADTFFGATDITGAEAQTLTSAGDASALHGHKKTFGKGTSDGDNGTITISHGLPATPRLVKLTLISTNSSSFLLSSFGVFDGTSYSAIYTYRVGSGSFVAGSSTSKIGQLSLGTTETEGTAVTVTTLNATQIVLTNTKGGGSAVPYTYLWEAYA